MIKILINEEEVVSDSTLQIKEEMLTTSSTVLKNCYPKSWELDKDYVSRYYFPKDYSKCEIYDTYEKEIGKNLLDESDGYSRAYWDQDGAYKSTGTALRNCLFSQDIPVEEGKTYCFSVNTTVYNIIISGWNTEEMLDWVQEENTDNIIYTVPTGVEFILISFNYNNSSQINNTIVESVEAMLQEGEERINPYRVYGQSSTITVEDLLFCGVVKNTGNISLNPRDPHFVDLQILDFKTLLSEGETLNYVIADKTIEQAIQQVISSIADYGFVLGNINIQNKDAQMGAYSTLDKTAYDVFQYIAEITQSRWTTRLIDENTVAIDFFDPLLASEKKEIKSTEQYYCDNKIIDIKFSYSTNDYRNKQIMTSDEVFANITQTETIVADGYTKVFNCQNKLGYATNITVNGVQETIATKNEVEQGVSADFVYTPGETTFTSNSLVSTSSIIAITYYPLVKGREIAINSNETNRIETQINRKGVISRYENRNDTTDSLELQKIGQSYIKYKGSAEIILTIQSEKDLFNVGEIVSYDSIVDDLDTDYMVKSKETDLYLNAGKVFYIYELSSNFNSENAINYFDNQRAKTIGNIGEGETITRNIDFEDEALIIFYDTNITEISILNPTELDFALDGVLI